MSMETGLSNLLIGRNTSKCLNKWVSSNSMN